MPSNLLAAIDLGSNSFHLVVARVLDGRMQIVDRLKQRVRLAEGMDEHKCLSEESMQRGLDCLALFAERLQGFCPDAVRITGTFWRILSNFFIPFVLNYYKHFGSGL